MGVGGRRLGSRYQDRGQSSEVGQHDCPMLSIQTGLNEQRPDVSLGHDHVAVDDGHTQCMHVLNVIPSPLQLRIAVAPVSDLEHGRGNGQVLQKSLHACAPELRKEPRAEAGSQHRLDDGTRSVP